MTLLAVPNVSEGRNGEVIEKLRRTIEAAGARVLDVHTDPIHNRSVFTVTGRDEAVTDAMVRLAGVSRSLIDLTTHVGQHPRLGALDVCPFVPFRTDIARACRAALMTADRIGKDGFPVFLYGAVAPPGIEHRVADLRKGGLQGLIRRVAEGLVPDRGPASVDPRIGCVCVGARGPLIAFNVNLASDVEVAREIAARVREAGGGPPGVRALAFAASPHAQVSMNITQPERAGIEVAFSAVERAAVEMGAEIVSTEIVGLVEERFLPGSDAKAARLLVEPGRSLESKLDR